MRPPCISTNFLVMMSPSPVPPNSLAMVASPCWNSANTVSILSGGMPIPVSATRYRSSSPCSSTAISTCPSRVNFNALPGKVHEALGDPPGVAVRERDVLGDRGDELQPLLRRQRARARPARSPPCPAPSSPQRELHASGLDLGEVEHVVDQPQQVLAARLDVGRAAPSGPAAPRRRPRRESSR